ncbi:protein kinase [Solwaraspora sp. WMMD791]|uniref:serine/threonine-protein kinase n=1 Tax=Solwaraspora sp. WMMD791 TaxID=3016086 RepID=UPI00249C6D07|nr:serine/threonine-protein kinase [Solwaraspora sp. WMMD791]WFE30686.1 protein kinase [Solwaraspora sp. WMMD791]
MVPGLSDLSVFARGGFATVYRAVQESVGREVAVKVENRPLDNEREQRRFMREARAAGRMSSHPHVVDLFDVGVTSDMHPYLIMEMCDGSYGDRMKTSPLDAFEARDVGVKIADALADAHHLGVLHRDVKPANILYSRFNEPALADFGLAVLVEARDASVTLEVLTPAYAAPESFHHRPPSPAADVYALCASLYAIMRGRPPRWEDDRSPSLVMLLELFDRPLPELPGVPPALTDVLRQGMANDPAARPSAVALRDMLAAVPLGPHWSPAAPHRPPFSIAPVSGGPSTGATVSGGRASVPAQPSAQPSEQTSWTVPIPQPPGVVRSPGANGVVGPPGANGAVAGAAGPPARPGAVTAHPRLRMLAGGLGVLVLLAMTSVGTWMVAKGSLPGGFDRPSAATPQERTPRPAGVTGPAGAVLPNCELSTRPGLRCPDDLECFEGELTGGQQQLAVVACTGRHTWETFAVGELPAHLSGADHATIEADPTVRAGCSAEVFRLVTLRMDVSDWRFAVLAPGEVALAGGEHSYRCLAGKGPNGLFGPALAAR